MSTYRNYYKSPRLSMSKRKP